jgi:RNA polymerase sigma factor (sigma-70 family)
MRVMVSAMDAEARREQLSAAIRRAARGDRAALRLIYDETAAKLFGICFRILHDRSEAEDVLQEVYLTVWRKAVAFDESKASPITWLVAIARNRAIDRLRSGGPLRLSEPIEAAETVSDPSPLPEEFAPTNDAFAKLPAGTVDTLLKPENQGELTQVLTYHVVPGCITAKDLMEMINKGGGKAMLKTVEGEDLTFEMKDGAIWVWDAKGDAAKITIKNVMQSNGVIHVIDTVLLPS